MANNEEKKFDVEFLAILMIKQLYADNVINKETYKNFQEKYEKGEGLCQCLRKS